MIAGRGENGSVSVVALVFLILLSAVSAGGALLLGGVFSYTSRSAERERLRLTLDSEAKKTIGLLSRDPTPEADSPMDPVWAALNAGDTPGVSVTLEDVSSRLNPNWVQKQLLHRTSLDELLRPSAMVEEVQKRREEKGLSTDIAGEYGDLIREEALSKYFTGYGYANLNTTDELALRKLYEIRMGNEAGAEVFRTRWQAALVQRKLLKRGDVRDFLGPDYSRLYPLMNAEPTFNVHFVEPLLLTELLSLPDLNIQQPRRAAQLILDARDHSEITAPTLQRMVGTAGDSLIYQYLGVTTWFWKVTISRGTDRLEVIVARIPSEKQGTPRYRLTEERYFP